MSFGAVLFSFSGRINRAKYWLAAIFWIVVFIVVIGIAIFAIGNSGIDWSANSIDPAQLLRAGLVPTILIGVVFIVLFISGLAVSAKRLHDRDKTAWWILPYYFGPGIISAIGEYAGSAKLVFTVLSLLLSLWVIIDLGFLRGTSGPNKYGPDPLATV